ncbi:MAG TPA: hypothetical protein VKX16_15615 [Chloroflexota bacterium]|nr:hypothetical protein [Chloroflexota bacterium]
MTICIGALCDSVGDRAQALVMASDRMVTWGFIEFEHEIPKGSAVSPTAFALIAGDTLRGSRLIHNVRTSLPAGSTSIPQIAETTAQGYAHLRMEQIQTEIFTPRGLALQQYYGGMQSQLMQGIVTSIDQQMMNFDFNVAVLLGGVDESGAHLLVILNPGGTYTDFAQIGFAAIGSGDMHAIQALIGLKQTRNRSLQETAFNVYAAKRRAEVAPGVGEDTDLWIIRHDGIFQPPKESLQSLEALYREYQRPVLDELRDQIRGLGLSPEGPDSAGREHGAAPAAS